MLKSFFHYFNHDHLKLNNNFFRVKSSLIEKRKLLPKKMKTTMNMKTMVE